MNKNSFETNDEYIAYSKTEGKDRIILLKVMCLAGILGSAINLFFNLFQPNVGDIFLSTINLLLFVITFIASRYIHNYRILTTSISIFIPLSILLLFIIKGYSESFIFGFILVPVISIPMLGIGLGLVLSILMFVLSLTLFQFRIYQGDIVTNEGLFIAAYASISSLFSAYEWLKIESRMLEIKTKDNFEKEEKSHQEKTDLLFELSHQIRTPLNSIMGITNLLKQDELTDDQQEYLDAINTSVMNLSLAMSSMINEIDTSPEKEQLHHLLYFNISEVINHVVNSYLANHPRQNININANFSEYIPTKLTGNVKKIEKILDTIFDSIVLQSQKKETEIFLIINNKKETETFVELVFEVHTSSIKMDNTEEKLPNEDQVSYNFASLIDVLDLSSAKQLVEANGGNLTHKKKDNEIDIFEFNFVLWKSQTATGKNTGWKSNTLVPKIKDMSESSILIVEDNMLNQKVLLMTLEPLVRNVEIANNGKEALKLFESSKFDLILMDIQMPVLDGYKTTAKIRISEIGTSFHIPIIAVTANALNGEMEKCLAIGMDDYISKPFQMERLLEKIEFFLGKKLE